MKKIYLFEVIICFILIIMGSCLINSNEDIACILMIFGILGLPFAPLFTFLIKLQKKKNIKDKEFRENYTNNQCWEKKYKNFYINQDDKLLLINNNTYKFEEVLDFEILVDDSTITKTSLSSAATRTLLLGVIGGATANRKNVSYCTQLKLKIILNNLSKPTEYIDFLGYNNKIKKNSFIYEALVKNIEDCSAILQIIISNNNKN